MGDVFPGIGIGGYRSFPERLQFLAPLERITVVIGPNNSGKSTLLALFSAHLHQLAQGIAGNPALGIDPGYARNVKHEGVPPFRVAWPLRVLTDEEASTQSVLPDLLSLLRGDAGLPWLRFTTNDIQNDALAPDPQQVDALINATNAEAWRRFAEQLAGVTSAPEANVRSVLDALRRHFVFPPPREILAIPAHRQVRVAAGEGPAGFSGSGLIEELDRRANPEPHELGLLNEFDRICRAVEQVLELRQFSYHVSHGQRILVLVINDERRPLAAVGTGYEHVVLLVAATVMYPEALLCVEEPEVHMHPRLQRRLADYLRHETTNQLLISTHSATLIDALRAETFRLELVDETSTNVTHPVAGQTLQLLDDLGYRASDLLQTNCAIWVEGPSDRIYVNWWLNSVEPNFEEGVHYTVMFYGGSLLARVSAAEHVDESHDLVPLRKLNQRFVIIADSDKKTEDAPLKERIGRLQAETQDHTHGYVWVTAGRTIENYIQPDLLVRAVQEVHPDAAKVIEPQSPWDEAPAAETANGNRIQVDKVRVAQSVAQNDPNLDVLDLRDRVDAMVATIRSAND